MSTVRVLIADDNAYMRTAYQRILDTQEDIQLVGMSAGNAPGDNHRRESDVRAVVLILVSWLRQPTNSRGTIICLPNI